MDEMIETCVPHIASDNTGMNENEARNMMKEWFPTHISIFYITIA